MTESSDVRSEIQMGLLKIGAALAEENKPPEARVQIQEKAVPCKLPSCPCKAFLERQEAGRGFGMYLRETYTIMKNYKILKSLII